MKSTPLAKIIYPGKLPPMKPQDLLKHYGTQAKIARAFGVTDAAVLKWLRSGELPALRVYQAREMLKTAQKRQAKA